MNFELEYITPEKPVQEGDALVRVDIKGRVSGNMMPRVAGPVMRHAVHGVMCFYVIPTMGLTFHADDGRAYEGLVKTGDCIATLKRLVIPEEAKTRPVLKQGVIA